MTDQRAPLRVYSVIKRETDAFWLHIGMAFPHKRGTGFNIVLNALPLDGKLVVRPVEDSGNGPGSAAAEPTTPRG